MATQEELKARYRQQELKARYDAQQSTPTTPAEKGAGTQVGESISALGSGLIKFGGNAWRGVQNLDAGIRDIGLGMPLEAGTDARRARLMAEDEASARDYAPIKEAHPYATFVGESVLPMLIPGGGPLRSALTAAATTGTQYQPNVSDQLVSGGLSGVIAGGMSKLLQPRLKVGEDAQKLLDEGITLTPGQMADPTSTAGRVIRQFEDTSTSLPGVGSQVEGLKRKTLEQFNVNRIDNALGQVGQKLDEGTKVGTEAFNQAYAKIGNVYKDNLSGKTLDFGKNGFDDLTSGLPGDLPEKYLGKLKETLTNVAHPVRSGKLTGEQYQEVLSHTRDAIRRYERSLDPLNSYVVDGLKTVESRLRGKMAMAAPDSARALSMADKAYAKLKVLEDAGSRAGGEAGMFSPAQLSAALRKWTSKMDLVRGKGFDQGTADAAKNVMAEMGNSRTAERLMIPGVMGGGMVAGAGIPILGGLGAASLGATKMGQSAIKHYLFEGDPIRQVMSQGVTGSMPYLSNLLRGN